MRSVDKKIILIFVGILCALIIGVWAINNSGTKNTQEFISGKDYVILDKQIQGAQNSVIEVFSYACPFCFGYWQIIPNVLETIPKNITFKQYHLSEYGDQGETVSEILAIATLRDKKLGLDSHSKDSNVYKILENFFTSYHIRKERLNDKELQKQAMVLLGIDTKEFIKEKQSSEVKKLLQQWSISYDVANIYGIPSFVVNGIYIINPANIKGVDDLNAKIAFLLTLPQDSKQVDDKSNSATSNQAIKDVSQKQ